MNPKTVGRYAAPPATRDVAPRGLTVSGATSCPLKGRLLLRQGEGDDLVVGDLRSREPAAGADDGDELPAIGAKIGNWRRLDRRRQLDLPQLLAGRGRKGAEPEIVRAADEREAAGGQHDTTGTGTAGVLQAGGQRVRDAERLPIRDVARIH